MNSATAASISNNVVSLLQGYITQLFTTLAPWVISIAILFLGFYVLKTLYHRHF